MARRRGRRGENGRRRAEGQPQPSAAAINRLDGCTLAVVADFCSLQDCCALRHRVSKRMSHQLAPADESEVFARVRVLRRVALWWHATTQHFVAWNKSWTSTPDLRLTEICWRSKRVNEKKRATLARQLHTLLRARHVRTLRLGGMPTYYYYIVAASRFVGWLTHYAQSGWQAPWQAPWTSDLSLPFFDLISRAEHDRKELVETCVAARQEISFPDLFGGAGPLERELLRGYNNEKWKNDIKKSYARCFSHQQFSEFLALDTAIRRGTQRPRASLTRPWLFLDRSMSRDYCPQCNRFHDQRKPSFHPRTTRRGGLPCSFCEMEPWSKALKRYRLTPEQLPRGPTWHRQIPAKREVIDGGSPWRPVNIGARHISDKRWVRVPMVNKCRAEEAARRVWGEDAQARAARAKTRAKKRKRRRQRARATGPKEKDQVRGLAGSLISSKA